jgi:hypothetical protein
MKIVGSKRRRRRKNTNKKRIIIDRDLEDGKAIGKCFNKRKH